MALALLTKKYEEGISHEESNSMGESIKAYEFVIFHKLNADDLTEETIKIKENSIYKLANIY